MCFLYIESLLILSHRNSFFFSSVNFPFHVMSDKVAKSFMYNILLINHLCIILYLYIRKSIGPRIEPCGTPHIIFLRADFVP